MLVVGRHTHTQFQVLRIERQSATHLIPTRQQLQEVGIGSITHVVAVSTNRHETCEL